MRLHRYLTLFGAAALVVACADRSPLGPNEGVRPSFNHIGPLTGAIWTTTADQCATVNENVNYDTKQDVHLNGGPQGGGPGLPPGDYYVKVTSPSGVLLGYTTTASVTVGANGRIVGCPNLWDILIRASNGLQGYDDTPNKGGEYKVWLSPHSDFSSSKTDNFKVRESEIEIPEEDLEITKTVTATYVQEITWDLLKTVDPASHSGAAGEVAGTSEWEIEVTKTIGAAMNFLVTGTITINNPNAFAVTVSVADVLDDGTSATVDCDAGTMGNQNTGIVIAGNGSVECSYTASPANAAATENTATATATAGYTIPNLEFSDTKPVNWSGSFDGFEDAELDDDQKPSGFPKTVSSSETITYQQEFLCPATTEVTYVNGVYSYDVDNTAVLTFEDDSYLDSKATVTVTCSAWVGETAVGEGDPWSATKRAPKNWFMYTPYTTETVDLIAGQHYDVGDITFNRNGTTFITIDLAANARFADVSDNVKIHVFACPGNPANFNYVQPGQFTYKFTAADLSTGGVFTTPIGLPNNTCYAIHADVERLL